MVAPNWLFAALSLNHRRAVPELWVWPLQVLRTKRVRRSWDPAGKLTGVNAAKVMVCRWALLTPLLPPETPLSWPELRRTPFTETWACRSNFTPTSSLFFSPIQTWAEAREVSWRWAAKSSAVAKVQSGIVGLAVQPLPPLNP